MRKLEKKDDDLIATLNNGEAHSVPLQAFVNTGIHVYVQLSRTRYARLDRRSQDRLAHWLEEGEDGSLMVRIQSKCWPIREEKKSN